MVRSRSRGASAVEYSIVLVLVTITGIVGYKTFGKRARCLMMKAGSAFQSEGGGGDNDCDAPAGGDSGGSGGPVADNSGPSTTVNCAACSVAGKCFVAGTPVLTEAGTLPIESVTTGMRVWSRPDEGGPAEWKPVTRTFMHVADALIRVTIADDDGVEESMELTPGHRVQVAGRGWVDAATLVPGHDRLVDARKRPLAVVAAESLPEPQTVFNLEVEDDHTYFVGAHAVWVHNDCFTQEIPIAHNSGGILPATNDGNSSGQPLTYHHIVPKNRLADGLNNIGKNGDVKYIAPALKSIIDSQYDRAHEEKSLQDNDGNTYSKEDIKNAIDQASKSDPTQDPQAIGIANKMYQWVPGNLLKGPSNRGDDPGSEIDHPAKKLLPDKKAQELQKLNDLLKEYNAKYANMTPEQLAKTQKERAKLLNQINQILMNVNKVGDVYPYDPDAWKDKHGKPVLKN